MDADMNVEMRGSKEPISVLVDKYFQYATFTKLHGDYTDELGDEAKKEAFRAFVESGSTTYIDENYRELLNAYRDGVLHDYMLGLVEQYGNDWHEVGMHVRHPSLTHELLDIFSKELRGMDLDHVEQINYATKLYLERLNKGVASAEVSETVSAVVEEPNFDVYENIYTFDKDGNVVFSETEEDDGDIIDQKEVDYILFKSSGAIYKAWKVMDTIILDVDGLSMDDINIVIAEAWKYRDKNGFYKVHLSVSGKFVDTKFRVEDLDLKEMTNLIVKLERCSA